MKFTEYKFYAFITCARGWDDEKWARRLQRGLENYRIPTEIFSEPEADSDARTKTLPKRFTVLRDGVLSNQEASLALTETSPPTPSALDVSRYLIVICSPRCAESVHVDDRVSRFIESGRSENVIPFIIEGTPAPSSDSEQQCYPPSLSRDILGVTLSEGSREEALVKIVARLLRVQYSRLYQRHLRERRRFIRRALAAASAMLAVMVVLASWALLAEAEARERREAADGLVEFLTAVTESEAFKNLPTDPRSGISEKIREYYEKRGEGK